MPTTQPRPHPGLFVAFEGGDGAGKSTQADLAQAWLHSQGHDVITTREPGGTQVGRAIREVLLHGEYVAPRAEALLFAADRGHHAETVIKPALARGAIVLTDRYIDSSVAYQGAARGLDHDEVRQLSLWATQGLVPDLTVLLDVPATTARRRRGQNPDRLESESVEFHERVRAQFVAMAQQDAARYLVLDAETEAAELAATVRTALEPLMATAAHSHIGGGSTPNGRDEVGEGRR